MATIDLNSDLGEGLPAEIDGALLALVSSANIACGGHAGDAATMRLTIRVALDRGVRIGAHPSYPDRANFGRTRLDMDPLALERSLLDQIEALAQAAGAEGGRVEYIKPHGALYNDAVAGRGDVVGVLSRIATKCLLPLMTLPGSDLERVGTARMILEGFLDRTYTSSGTLVPRSEPGALITDAEGVRRQALALAPRVASLSLHSDTPGSVELMREARRALEEAGYTIEPR